VQNCRRRGRGSAVPALRRDYWFVIVLFQVADLTVALRGEPDLDLHVDAKKEKFVVASGVPDVQIWTTRNTCSLEPTGRKIFDAGTVWQLYEDGDDFTFLFFSLAFGARPYRIARFNSDFSAGEVHLHRDFYPHRDVGDPLISPLDELLFSNLLARRHGLEIHACGVIDAHGLGYLFVGKSGAGKSTMSRLWNDVPGATILNDDRIILRKCGGRVWMYGTPWHGDAGAAFAGACPLAAIFFLRHGTSNYCIRQNRVNAAAALSSCSFPPFYSSALLANSLAFVDDVVATTPAFAFAFVPAPSAVALAQRQAAAVGGETQ
jgi:hypothetical protein